MRTQRSELNGLLFHRLTEWARLRKPPERLRTPTPARTSTGAVLLPKPWSRVSGNVFQNLLDRSPGGKARLELVSGSFLALRIFDRSTEF